MKKGMAGWLFLLLALAIPAVLFFNWWSHLNADRKKEMTQKIRTRLPEGGIFASARGETKKLLNPIKVRKDSSVLAAARELQGAQMSLSTAAAAAKTAASTATLAGATAPPASEEGETLATEGGKDSEGNTVAAQAETPQASSDEASPPESTEVPTATAQADSDKEERIPLEQFLAELRDPTLSPYDLYKLEQIQLDQMLRKQRTQKVLRKMKKRAVAPVESLIILQGIIAGPAGNKAIINDEVVSVGDLVGGKRRKAKIIKITPTSVIFTDHGRRFSKDFD